MLESIFKKQVPAKEAESESARKAEEQSVQVVSDAAKEDKVKEITKEQLYTFKSAKRLIEDGRADFVLSHLEEYPERDRPFIIAEVPMADYEVVKELVAKIPENLHNKVALAFINADRVDTLVLAMNSFKNLSSDIAFKIFEQENGHELVMANIDSFKESDVNSILVKLLDTGEVKLVMAGFSRIEVVDGVVAKKIIEKDKEHGLDFVIAHLKQFKNLGPEVILAMIESDYGSLVFEIPESFAALDSSVAEKLIEKGHVLVVALQLKSFKELGPEVAVSLVDAGFADKVLEHSDKFSYLNQKVAEAIVSRDVVENLNAVLDNAKKFSNLDYNALAKKAIESGDDFILVDRISELKDLGSDVALELIKKGWASVVRSNPSKFAYFKSDVADLLLSQSKDLAGDVEFIADNLDRFNTLSFAVAGEIVKNGDFEKLKKYITKVVVGTRGEAKVFYDLVSERYGSGVKDFVYHEIENTIESRKSLDEFYAELSQGFYSHAARGALKKVWGLDVEAAHTLIEHGEAYAVLANMERFNLESHEKIVRFILSRNEDFEKHVIYFLSKLRGLSQETFMDLVKYTKRATDRGVADFYVILRTLGSFSGLDVECANLILSDGHAESYIAKNINSFGKLNKEIGMRLVQAGHIDVVANNLDEFEGIHHNKAVLEAAKSNNTGGLLRNLDKFGRVNQEKMLSLILEARAPDFNALVENLDKLENVDYEKVAKHLIGRDQFELVLSNIEKFKGANHSEIIDFFLSASPSMVSEEAKNNRVRLIAQNLEKMPDVDRVALAKKLIDREYFGGVLRYSRYFPGVDMVGLAKVAIAKGNGLVVFENLEVFKDKIDEVFIMLFEAGYASRIIQTFQGYRFTGSFGFAVAEKLIEMGHADFVARDFDVFKKEDREKVRGLLIAHGWASDGENKFIKLKK